MRARAIVKGDANSITALGPAGIKGGMIGQKESDLLAHFIQVENLIRSSSWRAGKVTFTSGDGAMTSEFPVLESFVYAAVYFRQLMSDDDGLFREACDTFIRYTASDVKRWLLTVAQELNDRGWVTKRWNTKAATARGGFRWTKDNVLSLLRNVVYIGKVRHKQDVYPGEHTGIVDQAVFDEVQALLSDNGRSSPNGPRGTDGAILCGLLRCKSCGCAMTPSCSVKKNRRYRYYVCVNAQKRGYRECPSPSVSAEVLETFVVDQIREIGRDPDLIAATFAEVQRQAVERLESLKNVADRLETQISGIYQRLAQAASRPDELAVLNAEVDERQRRLAQLRLQIETTGRQRAHVGDVRRALVEFDGVWGALNRREQGELLRHVLEQVEFDGELEEVTLAFRFGRPADTDNQLVEEAA